MLDDSSITIHILRHTIEDDGQEHGFRLIYVHHLLRYLRLRKRSTFLHLNEGITQLGVSSHHVRGKTVLCPRETIKVTTWTLEGL